MAEAFLMLSQDDQREVLEIVREKTQRPTLLLEKDVWVVWALGALFDSALADDLTFKGGTSLSKAYKVIDRFSEDIDLTYDIRKLIPDLIGGDGFLPSSRSQASKWTRTVRERLPEWIATKVRPIIEAALARDQLHARLEMGGEDNDKLLLHYPTLKPGSGYVRTVVTLEFGARATGEPHQALPVACDMEGHVEDVSFPTARPLVMSVARTFWEKATAAHVYCAQGRIRGERYARHWHDLAAIAHSRHGDEVITDCAVAAAVAEHKAFFFLEKNVDGFVINYKSAVTGNLRIVPEGAARDALQEDYAAMIGDGMMLGEALAFDQLMSEQDVQQASKQVDAAQNESVAANTERSAILSEAFSRGLSKLRSSRSSNGSTSSSFEQMGETLNELNQITKSVAENTGLSQAQVARIAFGAAGHVGINTGFAGGQLRASAEKSYLSSLSAQEQKALASMSGEQLVAFKQFGDRVSRDSSFLNAVSSDSHDAREMSSRLGSTVARSERAEASLAERTSFAERVSSAYEKGESISIDIAQDPHNLEMFMRYAEEYGGDSAAAHALMESELARQSPRPNRVFSDGTALPASFGNIRDQHVQQRGNTALTPDIIGQHQSNRDQISHFENTAPSRERTPAASPAREEVHARGNQIRSDAASRRADFDAKAEIIKTDDGTLASKKSLLVQSGKQVGRDAGATFDNAKEVVNDLLKKK